MEKQYLRECAQCDRTMVSTDPALIYCSARCAKRARFAYDPSRSRRPLVACVVCGRVFAQEAATGRLRVCCPLHYGGYRDCAGCGKRCRPRPGGKLCRECKNQSSQPDSIGLCARWLQRGAL
jgi:hypothetical protein